MRWLPSEKRSRSASRLLLTARDDSSHSFVVRDISKYKRGATLLLRDSLPPRPTDATAKPADYSPSAEPHVCITDHHATVREQVGSNEFEQQAGSFFQNNNSILPSLLDYVREAVGPRKEGEERYLVDAYTGSGLFAISLADQFDRVEGVEIDKASIRWAKKNADYNKGPGRGEVGFRDGKAEEIFKVRLASLSLSLRMPDTLIDPLGHHLPARADDHHHRPAPKRLRRALHLATSRLLAS